MVAPFVYVVRCLGNWLMSCCLYLNDEKGMAEIVVINKGVFKSHNSLCYKVEVDECKLNS